MANFQPSIPFDMGRGLARVSKLQGILQTLSNAFDPTTGHKHDGTSGNGATLGTMSNVIAHLGAPAVAATTTIVATVTGVANMGAPFTVAANPDVPRTLSMTLGDGGATLTALTVTIVGTDVAGAAVTEAHTFTGAATFHGTKIFATVTSVTPSARTGGDTNTTFACGIDTVIGLPTNIVASAAVKHVYLGTGGSTHIATPTVATGVQTSGVDVSASTYNGTKELRVFYNPGQ